MVAGDEGGVNPRTAPHPATCAFRMKRATHRPGPSSYRQPSDALACAAFRLRQYVHKQKKRFLSAPLPGNGRRVRHMLMGLVRRARRWIGRPARIGTWLHQHVPWRDHRASYLPAGPDARLASAARLHGGPGPWYNMAADDSPCPRVRVDKRALDLAQLQRVARQVWKGWERSPRRRKNAESGPIPIARGSKLIPIARGSKLIVARALHGAIPADCISVPQLATNRGPIRGVRCRYKRAPPCKFIGRKTCLSQTG